MSRRRDHTLILLASFGLLLVMVYLLYQGSVIVHEREGGSDLQTEVTR